MEYTVWKNELENLQKLVDNKVSTVEIGKIYNVSKQRMYQVFTKFGINSPQRITKTYIKSMPPKYYWVNKMLGLKKFSNEDRLYLLNTMNIPDNCPALGIPLNYGGGLGEGYTRKDNSPSIDRIDSDKDYTIDNIQILSWRANRIKNDATIKELGLIYNYLKTL